MADAAVQATEASSPIAGVSPPPARASFVAEHDLATVAVIAVLLAIGAVGYRALAQTHTATWSGQGISLRYPSEWIPLPVSQTKTEMGALEGRRGRELPFLDVEVRKFDAPDVGLAGLSGVLDMRRLDEYHEFYRSNGTKAQTVNGRAWDRTEFKHAQKRLESDDPQVYAAVEYAAVSGGNLYVVTLHGLESDVRRLEPTIFGSLEVKP